MFDAHQKLMFSAEDIRQYVYCPRKIYYRYVLRARLLTTPKMNRGQELHEKLCKDRVREPVSDSDVRYYYNLYFSDEDLGLSAIVDVLEVLDNYHYKVIDLKSSKPPEEGVYEGEKMQVAAQALLVETNLGVKVTEGAIFYIRHNRQVDFEITSLDLLNVMRILERIKQIVYYEEIPKPTSERSRCNDCECRRFCWWE